MTNISRICSVPLTQTGRRLKSGYDEPTQHCCILFKLKHSAASSWAACEVNLKDSWWRASKAKKKTHCSRQHSCCGGISSNWQGDSWASDLWLFTMFSISSNDKNTPFSSTWTHMESGFSSLQGRITNDTSCGRTGVHTKTLWLVAFGKYVTIT